MNRFHDSRFRGVRLVCRLRRGSAAGGVVQNSRPGSSMQSDAFGAATTGKTIREDDSGAGLDESQTSQDKEETSTEPATPVTTGAEHVPEKIFIVKSLTLQDLEASVREGIWATQSHNEENMNKAFEVSLSHR